jgi:hypothetical protein
MVCCENLFSHERGRVSPLGNKVLIPARADCRKGADPGIPPRRPRGPELDPVTECLESRLATFLGTIMLKGAAKNGKGKKR